MMFKNADGKGVDLSALNGKEQELPFKVLKVANSMTDDMQFTMQSETFKGANNLPTLNHKGINAEEYMEEILLGFTDIITFFLEKKEEILAEGGPIAAFEKETIRIVARATQQYFNFLNESSHPDYMRDALYLENLYDRLWFYPYVNKGIVQHEISDMLDGDIPIFTASINSRDMVSSKGIKIENAFEESGYHIVRERISNFDKKELETQRNWIKMAILGTKEYKPRIEKMEWVEKEIPANSNELFLEEAKKVAEQILSELVFSKNKKTASLLSLNASVDGKWFVSPASQGLYDGLGGISLFLLYLWKETGESKYLEAAEGTLQSAINPMIEPKGLISAFSGTFSVLYSLVHFQQLVPSDDYEKKIQNLKARLKANAKEDEAFDLLGGSAGIIQVLLNLFEVTSDQEYIEIAEMYGKHLIDNADDVGENEIAWKNSHSQNYLGGLSHGTSGIAWSLLRLSDVTNRADFREAARKALRFDQSLFDEGEKAWRDNRDEEKKFLHQWCHGSTGIGLGRIKAAKIANVDTNDSEIHQALENTRGYKTSDTLCHGNFGDIELLLQAATYFNDEKYSNAARKKAFNVLLQKEERGSYLIDGPQAGIIQPSMFTGLTGIGMQLLRIYNPEQVPAVMVLENVK